jgi:hypothetical protein
MGELQDRVGVSAALVLAGSARGPPVLTRARCSFRERASSSGLESSRSASRVIPKEARIFRTPQQGTGGGQPPPVTRWVPSNGHPYHDPGSRAVKLAGSTCSPDCPRVADLVRSAFSTRARAPTALAMCPTAARSVCIEVTTVPQNGCATGRGPGRCPPGYTTVPARRRRRWMQAKQCDSAPLAQQLAVSTTFCKTWLGIYWCPRRARGRS